MPAAVHTFQRWPCLSIVHATEDGFGIVDLAVLCVGLS
jgi:hypothetical protein